MLPQYAALCVLAFELIEILPPTTLTERYRLCVQRLKIDQMEMGPKQNLSSTILQ